MDGNITNYFHPSISDHFEAYSISIHHRGRKILGPKEDSLLDELMPFGIAEAAKENMRYQSLLKTLGIHFRSNEDLIRSALKRNICDRHNIKEQRCREQKTVGTESWKFKINKVPSAEVRKEMVYEVNLMEIGSSTNPNIRTASINLNPTWLRSKGSI